MNDVELIDRLERELTVKNRWPDVERAISARVDPSLAENELLVFPSRKAYRGQPAEALRVVVEHLVLPEATS